MLQNLNHHFYLVVGDADVSHELLRRELEEVHGFIFTQNPDIYLADTKSFAVEDARVLKDFFATKALSSGRRLALVRTRTLTSEAQNALLKLTEELPESNHIFFVIPHTGAVVATLLSRAEIIFSSPSSQEMTSEAAEFFANDIPDRLATVQKIIAAKDKTKDKESAVNFVDSLIIFARQEKLFKALADLYMVRGYIDDVGSSVKLLLEHISLILPTCTASIHSKKK